MFVDPLPCWVLGMFSCCASSATPVSDKDEASIQDVTTKLAVKDEVFLTVPSCDETQELAVQSVTHTESAIDATTLGTQVCNTDPEHTPMSDISNTVSQAQPSTHASMRKLSNPSEAEVAELYDVPLAAVRELGVLVPESPPAERGRYLARQSAGGDPTKAAKLLREYLDARSQEMPLWPCVPAGFCNPVMINGPARDSTITILIEACMVDPKFKPETYCHALVRALDSHVARDSAVRVTVLVDSRSHHGDYPNAKMWGIWRHLSAVYKALQFYFPERMARAIVFPVDAVEDMALRMVK